MTDKKIYQEWYRLARRREFLESHDKESAWASIQHRIDQRERHRVSMWRRCGGIAAMVILLGGAGVWWNMHRESGSNTTSRDTLLLSECVSVHKAEIESRQGCQAISVPMGAEYAESMPDGTKVVMNAGTVLTYSDDFNGAKREVELSGEAYFEVAHYASKPFVVNTPSGRIEVLGTHFNVVADEDCTTVTLEEGSVRLYFADHQFLMKPGEQACMRKDGDFDIRHVNATNYTSWSTGVYEFQDVTLDEIVRQLSLWYGVDIRIADPELEQSRYTGVIMRRESLENAIDMLTTISDIKITVKATSVEICRK